MALHGSLEAAVLLGHRNRAPLEGQPGFGVACWGRNAASSHILKGQRPPPAPSLLPSGQKQGAGQSDSPKSVPH